MTFPKVHLRDIPESGAEYSFPVDSVWLSAALQGTDYTAAKDPSGEMGIQLQLSGDDVILRGKGSVSVKAECVRCLEPVELRVECDFSLLLEPAAAAKRPAGKLNTDDEYELTDEELVKDVYQDDAVEVGTWVREQILIELPPHPAHDSCSPPSLAKTEKTETKVKDPRLAGLEKFKIKE